MTKLNRRSFLQKSAATAAGAFVLPRFSIGKPGPSANSKLNVAMIGAGNIAKNSYGGCQSENIVRCVISTAGSLVSMLTGSRN